MPQRCLPAPKFLVASGPFGSQMRIPMPPVAGLALAWRLTISAYCLLALSAVRFSLLGFTGAPSDSASARTISRSSELFIAAFAGIIGVVDGFAARGLPFGWVSGTAPRQPQSTTRTAMEIQQTFDRRLLITHFRIFVFLPACHEHSARPTCASHIAVSFPANFTSRQFWDANAHNRVLFMSVSQPGIVTSLIGPQYEYSTKT